MSWRGLHERCQDWVLSPRHREMHHCLIYSNTSGQLLHTGTPPDYSLYPGSTQSVGAIRIPRWARTPIRTSNSYQHPPPCYLPSSLPQGIWFGILLQANNLGDLPRYLPHLERPNCNCSTVTILIEVAHRSRSKPPAQKCLLFTWVLGGRFTR